MQISAWIQERDFEKFLAGTKVEVELQPTNAAGFCNLICEADEITLTSAPIKGTSGLGTYHYIQRKLGSQDA